MPWVRSQRLHVPLADQLRQAFQGHQALQQFCQRRIVQ